MGINESIIHQCSQHKELKKLWEKIHQLETKTALQQSDIQSIKGDLEEMKKDLKAMSGKIQEVDLKIESGNNRLFLTLIISGVVLLAGIFAEKII